MFLLELNQSLRRVGRSFCDQGVSLVYRIRGYCTNVNDRGSFPIGSLAFSNTTKMF